MKRMKRPTSGYKLHALPQKRRLVSYNVFFGITLARRRFHEEPQNDAEQKVSKILQKNLEFHVEK